jgi:CelD/BcsL family acetyltransferase involved in cellulose biosynthesis
MPHVSLSRLLAHVLAMIGLLGTSTGAITLQVHGRHVPVPHLTRRHAGHARLRTESITHESGFEAIADAWDALLDQSGTYSYFVRAGWNRGWWQHHSPAGSRLHLVTCTDGTGRLVGLAPLYARQHRVFGVPCTRELLFLGTGIPLKTSEHLDIVALPGYEAEVATAIAAHLRAQSDWDRLWLWQVAQASVTLPHFMRAMGDGAVTEECDRAPYIDTSLDWASLKRSYGRSMRRNMEYYARRLFKAHECEFTLVAAREHVGPAMDALVELHQARWESQGEPGAFRKRNFETFLRQAAYDAFDGGRLRLWTLRVDGRIEAALIGFVDNGVLHYFQKGFNPAFAKLDLGTAMLALCVQASVEDPAIHSFDFMGGGAPYKDMWARQARISTVSTVLRPTWRTQVQQARERCVGASQVVYRAVTPVWFREWRRERIRRARLDTA